MDIKQVLDSLVNEQVNVIHGPTSCGILDLVLWKQHRIYSIMRTGFIWTEVEKIEFPTKFPPQIYLKKNRIGEQYLTKKEMKKLLEHF